MIHVVKSGECLSTIAASYGFKNWQTIYDHPDNAAFRTKRPNPNLIYPGDALFIPTKDDASALLKPGQTSVFVLRRAKRFVRIALKDAAQRALADEPYVLLVDGEPIASDTKTDANGVVLCEVPPTATSAVLHIAGCGWDVEIAALNPLDAETADGGVSGAQGRLLNLGYAPGVIDGVLGTRTTQALRAFQSDHLPSAVTGTLDDATRSKLAEVHGC